MAARYAVRYARFDGNVYVIGDTDDYTHACQMADDFEQHRAARHLPRLPVMVWDTDDDDYERGDVRNRKDE